MDNPDFEAIVNLYYGDLYRFAYSLAKNPDDACDLTQQCFAIYAEKGHQVREKEKIKSWLFTTLYRDFLRQHERGKRMVSSEDTLEEIPETATESRAEREFEHTELLAALQSLNESHRSILTLFYLDQCSYKEIAEILDIPIGTTMSRLSRAKDLLRKKLEATTGGIKPDPDSSHNQSK